MRLTKADGRNEMPFGRDTQVVPSNIVLHRGPDPSTGRENLGSEPSSDADAAYRQITSAVIKDSQVKIEMTALGSLV